MLHVDLAISSGQVARFRVTHGATQRSPCAQDDARMTSHTAAEVANDVACFPSLFQETLFVDSFRC